MAKWPNIFWQQKNISGVRCVYPEELASFGLVGWWHVDKHAI